MSITSNIVRFVTDLTFETIPPKALQTAKTAVLDCLGVTLAGSKERSGEICAAGAREENAKKEATVFGQGFKSSALNAALANGTAAHALDFDHSFTLGGQPSAPIIPALFSLGEALAASGRDLLTAYVAGFEVTAKLVIAVRDSTEEGWHAPGTLGVFGATAGCAKLLGLNYSEIEMALGITASMAAGVACNFGTMTKPLHVGLSARNGLLAAKLARSGFTANAQAIEAAHGLSNVLYRTTLMEASLDGLGAPYEIERHGIKIKPYPCGGLAHTAIDAILQLRGEYGIKADAVSAIDVDAARHTVERIVFHVPKTGLQGKFSMNYLLARALIDGEVTLDAFTDSAVRDPATLRLAEKVRMKLDPDLERRDAGSRPARVTVRLIDGRTLSREVHHPKGSLESPMTPAELDAKFTRCAERVLRRDALERARNHIHDLDRLEDVGRLCDLLAG
jgi:2-methylcitrate dehydratase PrpD